LGSTVGNGEPIFMPILGKTEITPPQSSFKKEED